MKLNKSSFIKNYRKKVISSGLINLQDAVRYAFELTDQLGVTKIDRAIAETSIKFDIDEDTLRKTINNDDFIIENLMKGTNNE